MKYAALLAMLGGGMIAQSWQPQASGSAVALHGVFAVNANLAWASGAKGTFLRTADGGVTWHAASVPGASDMDFRSIYSSDEHTAVLLSTGPATASRVYRTVDAGASWHVVYTNGDPSGSFAAMGFWDEAHGILLGNAVKGRFTIMTTADGGATWHREKGPSANEKEATPPGSALFTRGTREAWFVSNSPAGARVFHTADAGQTWSAAKLPVTGASSVAFAGGSRGVAIGAGGAAVSEDGGKTWTAASAAKGSPAAVAYAASQKIFIAVGASGSDVSHDGGSTWMPIGTAAFDNLSFAADGSGWAVGADGAIAKFASTN